MSLTPIFPTSAWMAISHIPDSSQAALATRVKVQFETPDEKAPEHPSNPASTTVEVSIPPGNKGPCAGAAENTSPRKAQAWLKAKNGNWVELAPANDPNLKDTVNGVAWSPEDENDRSGSSAVLLNGELVQMTTTGRIVDKHGHYIDVTVRFEERPEERPPPRRKGTPVPESPTRVRVKVGETEPQSEKVKKKEPGDVDVRVNDKTVAKGKQGDHFDVEIGAEGVQGSTTAKTETSLKETVEVNIGTKPPEPKPQASTAQAEAAKEAEIKAKEAAAKLAEIKAMEIAARAELAELQAKRGAVKKKEPQGVEEPDQVVKERKAAEEKLREAQILLAKANAEKAAQDRVAEMEAVLANAEAKREARKKEMAAEAEAEAKAEAEAARVKEEEKKKKEEEKEPDKEVEVQFEMARLAVGRMKEELDALEEQGKGKAEAGKDDKDSEAAKDDEEEQQRQKEERRARLRTMKEVERTVQSLQGELTDAQRRVLQDSVEGLQRRVKEINKNASRAGDKQGEKKTRPERKKEEGADREGSDQESEDYDTAPERASETEYESASNGGGHERQRERAPKRRRSPRRRKSLGEAWGSDSDREGRKVPSSRDPRRESQSSSPEPIWHY